MGIYVCQLHAYTSSVKNRVTIQTKKNIEEYNLNIILTIIPGVKSSWPRQSVFMLRISKLFFTFSEFLPAGLYVKYMQVMSIGTT